MLWITESELQEWVSQQLRRGVDELRWCPIDTWSSIQQTVIDQTIDQWQLGWGHALGQEAESLNIWYNVSLLRCIIGSTTTTTMMMMTTTTTTMMVMMMTDDNDDDDGGGGGDTGNDQYCMVLNVC